MKSRTIDYTAYNFQEIRDELIALVKETNTFKDIDVLGSNIRTYVDMNAFIGALFGYYINNAANETFLTTAKKYKNIIKIAQQLNYDVRGREASSLNVVGELLPEYVFGKQGKYIEIPAYSIFPSTEPSKDNKNFIFTNQTPITHVVKGHGLNYIDESDITYKGLSLPLTKPASFFTNSLDEVKVNTTSLEIPLSFTKQMWVLSVNENDSYKHFDTESYPLRNFSDGTSVGQSFNKTIIGEEYSNFKLDTDIFMVLNFDKNQATPTTQFFNDLTSFPSKTNDRIALLKLIENNDGTITLYAEDIYTENRFITGNTGVNNLDSISFEYGKFTNSSAINQIKFIINKTGDQPPFSVLMNGKLFTFSSGTIETKVYANNYFDSNVSEWNINLVIPDIHMSELNYNAYLEITTEQPKDNALTIAKIDTNYVSNNNENSIEASDTKFGNFRIIDNPIDLSTQRSGTVYFSKEKISQLIVFTDGETVEDYIISLSSEGNVRSWYSDKTDTGFVINVEKDTGFEGDINWLITEINEEKYKEIDVTFDFPLENLSSGSSSPYMVHLTSNDNVEVWYEDLSIEGFKIFAERNFVGKVSWSIHQFDEEGIIKQEPANKNRQQGRIILPADKKFLSVSLDNVILNSDYVIQLLTNNNVKIWYSNKRNDSFEIHREIGFDEDIIIEWFVDVNKYKYQMHGELEFKGIYSNQGYIPGFQFVNVPETFEINDLKQGEVGFTFIEKNATINNKYNTLNLSLDYRRSSETDIKFLSEDNTIGTNTIKIYIKTETENWYEAKRIGTGFQSSNEVGNLVYRIRMNQQEQISIEFGDGINWGTNVNNFEIIVFGLKTEGFEGNIGANILDKNVSVSQYVLGNDYTDIKFENSLINLIGLKTDDYFKENKSNTNIVDSEGTVLSSTDLQIIQKTPAYNGRDVETSSEIKINATNAFMRNNKNISLNDYERYSNELFSNYILKTKAYNYEQAKEIGIIDNDANYWFNHIFLVMLNKNKTNRINKNLKDMIINKMNNDETNPSSIKFELYPAKWVPIDVSIRYKKTNYANIQKINSMLKKNIVNFFIPEDHEMGEKIHHSDISKICNIEGIDTIEIMLNKDPDNKFSQKDYDTSTNNTNDVNVARRNKIQQMTARDPSLVKIFQPLLDNLNISSEKEWHYTLDVVLEYNEFPKIGDIVIEVE